MSTKAALWAEFRENPVGNPGAKPNSGLNRKLVAWFLFDNVDVIVTFVVVIFVIIIEWYWNFRFFDQDFSKNSKCIHYNHHINLNSWKILALVSFSNFLCDNDIEASC